MKRAIESRVASFSLAGGLVHSGGELVSWVDSLGVSAREIGALGEVERDILGAVSAGEEGAVAAADGGVCGLCGSSEVLAGLPKPDSLHHKYTQKVKML